MNVVNSKDIYHPLTPALDRILETLSARCSPSKPGLLATKPVDLWIDSLILREKAEKGLLSDKHPITKVLNREARALREVVANDPLLKHFGLRLPKDVKVSVLISCEENAWVNPRNPGEIYITTGFIERLATYKRNTAVLAHEQGHLIRKALGNRPSPIETPSERFGEPIWRDPVLQALRREAPSSAAQKLFSQEEELWCDTHGSFEALDGIGIDPTAVTAWLYRILETEGSDFSRQRHIQDITKLKEAIRSHPPTPHRIWVAETMAQAASFPSTLNGPLKEDYDFEGIRPRSKVEEIVRFIEKYSKLLDFWVLHAFHNAISVEREGGNHICIPYPTGSYFKAEIKERLENLPREMRNSVLLAMHYSLKVPIDDLCRVAKYRKVPIQPIERNSCKKIVAQALRQKPQTDHALFEKTLEVAQIEFNDLVNSLELNDIEKELLSIGGSIKQKKRKITATPTDLVNLEKLITPILFSVTDLCNQVSNQCFGKTFRFVPIDWAQFGRTFQGGECQEVLTGGAPIFTFSEFGPHEKVRDATLRILKKALIKGLQDKTFRKPEGAFSWLKDLYTAQGDKAYPWGRGVDEQNIFCLGLEIVSHFIDLGHDPIQLIRSMHSYGLNPGIPYPIMVSSHWSFDVDSVVSGVKVDADDPFYQWIKREASAPSLISKLGEYYPQMADRWAVRLAGELFTILNKRFSLPYKDYESLKQIDEVQQSEKRRATPFYELPSLEIKERLNKLLPIIKEPDRIVSKLEGPQSINLHDLWAFNNFEDPRSKNLRHELVRGKDTMEEYLLRLKASPHRFTVSIWKRVAEEAIHELSDLEKLCAFVEAEYLEEDKDDFPTLEKNRVESLVQIVAVGFRNLERSTLDVSDPATLERLYNLISDKGNGHGIPRGAHRNGLVLWVLEQVKGSDAVPLRECQRFSRLMETEPFWEMLERSIDEYRESGDPRLRELEMSLPRLPRSLVHTKYLGRDLTKEKVEEILSAGVVRLSSLEENQPIPDDYVLVIDRNDRDVEHYLKWPPLDKLPKLCTITALRNTAIELIKEEGKYPRTPLQVKTKAIREAESVAEIMLAKMGLGDPLGLDPFEGVNNLNSAHLFAFKEGQIDVAQPVPTPLKDSWLLKLLKRYEAHGGELNINELRELRSSAYLPETIESIGHRLWAITKVHLTKENSSSVHDVLDLVADYFPYYSLTRNSVLQEAARTLVSDGYDRTAEISRHITWLYYTPGKPLPLPSTRALTINSLVEFQIKALESFEDFDIVEFILYCKGVIAGEKPYSTQVVECLLGHTLDTIVEQDQHLDPGAKREMLHRLFGGSRGILARNDPLAVEYLASQVAAKISQIFKADYNITSLIQDLSRTVLADGGFSIHDRTEVLAVASEWFDKMKGQKLNAADEALLVRELFGAFKSAGDKFLQSLVTKANRFPQGWVPYLRNVQYNNNPGHPLLPFHSMKAHGVEGLRLGNCRAVGSIGELWELRGIGDTDFEGVLLKILRGDTIASTRALRKPMERVAEVLNQHKLAWGETVIGTAVDAAHQEGREMVQEMKRTGKPIAQILRRALGGKIGGDKRGVILRASERNDIYPVIVPRVIPLGMSEVVGDGFCHAFALSDLGPDFHVLAEYESKRGDLTLSQFLKERGVSLQRVADQVWEVFFTSFIEQGVLFKDLSFGNIGIVEGKDPLLGMIDFGGVIENFPDSERKWIARMAGALAMKDLPTVKKLLMASATDSDEDSMPAAETFKLLDDLLKELEQEQSKRREISLGAGLNDFSKIVTFLSEHWTLSREVRDFCEAARKVIDEFGAFVSAQALNALGQRLTPLVIEMLLAPVANISEESVTESEEVEDAPPERDIDRVFQSAKGLSLDPQHQERFNNGTLPAGTLLWIRGDSGWSCFRSISEQPWPSKKFIAQGRNVSLARGNDVFLEIQEGEFSYYKVV